MLFGRQLFNNLSVNQLKQPISMLRQGDECLEILYCLFWLNDHGRFSTH